MLSATAKAEILVESLPYIQKFSGKTIVIKLGGHAITNPEIEKSILQDIILMKLVGIKPVIVHGGGPGIDAWMKKAGLKPTYINGLRVTDEATMEIVEMVLNGKINKSIVGTINQLGGKAIGLCGKDGNLIQAAYKKILLKDETGEHWAELGLVGEIIKVNPEIIHLLTSQDYIPVISPVGIGPSGESLNINADSASGALGGALKADKLVLLTDVEGIYTGDGPASLASELTEQQIRELIASGAISGGMLPKVESCITALSYGIRNIHIIDGRKPHTLLLEIFTNKGIGTMIVSSEKD